MCEGQLTGPQMSENQERKMIHKREEMEVCYRCTMRVCVHLWVSVTLRSVCAFVSVCELIEWWTDGTLAATSCASLPLFHSIFFTLHSECTLVICPWYYLSFNLLNIKLKGSYHFFFPVHTWSLASGSGNGLEHTSHSQKFVNTWKLCSSLLPLSHNSLHLMLLLRRPVYVLVHSSAVLLCWGQGWTLI